MFIVFSYSSCVWSVLEVPSTCDHFRHVCKTQFLQDSFRCLQFPVHCSCTSRDELFQRKRNQNSYLLKYETIEIRIVQYLVRTDTSHSKLHCAQIDIKDTYRYNEDIISINSVESNKMIHIRISMRYYLLTFSYI